MNFNIHAGSDMSHKIVAYSPPGIPIRQLLVAMKLTVILLTIFCLQVSATTNAQQITLKVNSAPFETVIKSVHQQSGYAFLYNTSFLKNAKPVTVNLKSVNVEQALKAIFEDQPFTYAVKDKAIIIKEYEQKFQTEINGAEISIEGTIIDTIGMPLPGVTVKVKNTQQVTISDPAGHYKLIAVPINGTLVFSTVGYGTQEIPVNNRTQINVTLRVKPQSLSSVNIVSTGYQEIPKERATGSFSKVDNKVLESRVATNILDKLDGITSGLVFNRSSTSDATISIRGNSTIYANTAPLIVLDGFAYDGNVNDINPNDVEDITILKDAAAASIWGVRASNGVIVIRTKKGKLNSPMQISFNANTTAGGKPDLYYRPAISSSSFIDMETTLFKAGFYNTDETNTTTRPALSPVVELLIAQRDGKITAAQANQQIDAYRQNDVRNDYSKYFLRNLLNNQYSLSLNGSTNNVRYLFSAGYDNNTQNFVGNKNDRLTIRSDNTFTIAKGLDLNAGIMYTSANSTQNSPGLSLLDNTATTKSLYPYAKLADDAGNALPVNWLYRTPFVLNAPSQGLLDWQYYPVSDVNNVNNQTTENYTRLTAGLNYNFLKNFNFQLNYQFEKSIGKTNNLNNSDSFFTRNLINSYSVINTNGTVTRNIPSGSILTTNNNQFNGQTLRGQLNYNGSWNDGKQKLAAIAGFEGKEVRNTNTPNIFYGYNPDLLTIQPVDYVTFFKQAYSTSTTARIALPANLQSLLNRFISYYSNASYVLEDKYIVSASARIDASNYFGVNSNQRSVPLWSAGIAWNVDRESFFKSDLLNRLKIRATYGFNGNINKTVTAYTTTSRSSDPTTGLPVATIISPPNADLTWEKVRVINLGLDFESKNEVISGSIEWYQKDGKDLFGFSILDYTSGLSSYKGNVASITGNGIDLELNTRNIDSKFKWYSTFIFSRATDKVTKLEIGKPTASNITNQTGVFSSTPVSLVPLTGHSIYGIYSYKWAGLDPATGDPQGYLNGTVSKSYSAILGNTDATQLIYSGSSRPTIFGSFRNTFSYNRFTLSANISYKLGYKFRRSSVNYSILSKNWGGSPDYDQRWQKTGDEQVTNVPSMPLVTNSQRDEFYQFSEALITDGSHIRLQDISLSYDFKQPRRTIFKSLQLYGYVNNVGILWRANKYHIDPDYVPVANEIYLPPVRTISIGIKGGF